MQSYYSKLLLSGKKLFDNADTYFESLIEPNINGMTEEQLKRLIEYSNENSQIYDRRMAYKAKNIIKKSMERKKPNFCYGAYGHFS